jgi:regulator of RNase E activity RraA
MSEPVTIAQSDFSTCELSDALLKLGVPHGGHIPDVHRITSHSHSERLCGPAYTVRLVLASDRDAPKLLQGHFVDLAPPNSVVFISVPPGSLSIHP